MSGRARTTASGCPICGKAVAASYRPFCSRRCADIDLNRWLRGGYAIPAVEEPEPGDLDGDGKAKPEREAGEG